MIDSDDSVSESPLRMPVGADKNKVILVVDDDPATRLLIRHSMEQSGYFVVEAADGLEAVKAATRQLPDLIIMDAVMPEMDGFRATREIKQVDDCKDIPILMATALDDDMSVAQAFDAGACDYVTKPFNWSVLQNRIARLLFAADAERKIRHLSYHDPLTGLPNRMLFMDRIDQAISRAQREKEQFALLFIDIDDFKVINDSIGHAAGDELLNIVSQRLRQIIRKSDTVARLGGDEFTVILEALEDVDGAINATKNILDALDVSIELNGKEVYVGGSIGIAMYPQDGENFGALLKNADTAMYRAKEQGRNTFQFYTAEMSQKAMMRLDLENQIRVALKEEEFVVYYQPKVDLSTGNICGVEALVRWEHPERGFMPPNDFIPIAEETGLITQLDQWVMDAACKQFQKWREAGLSLKNLSVNVSAKHFREGNLTEYCQTLLNNTQIPAECLEIELTESALVDNYNTAKDVLNDIHQMGIQIALDDFGTGYASMSYLKKFPFDTVKIDRSFVRDIPDDEEDSAIVLAMIQLTKALKLNTVAEGVEMENQKDFLVENQCLYGQGFLWSKPVSASDLEKLIS